MKLKYTSNQIETIVLELFRRVNMYMIRMYTFM